MITRIAFGLGLLAIGWIGVLAGVMRVSGEAPAAVVLFPHATFLEEVPKGVAVLSRGVISMTLVSEDANLTAALYDAGAWLVLPGGLSGCVGPKRS